MLTDHQLHQLDQLAGTFATARNVLRAGGDGGSRIASARGAPTLQEALDQAAIRFANLLAELHREKNDTRFVA